MGLFSALFSVLDVQSDGNPASVVNVSSYFFIPLLLYFLINRFTGSNCHKYCVSWIERVTSWIWPKYLAKHCSKQTKYFVVCSGIWLPWKQASLCTRFCSWAVAGLTSCVITVSYRHHFNLPMLWFEINAPVYFAILSELGRFGSRHLFASLVDSLKFYFSAAWRASKAPAQLTGFGKAAISRFDHGICKIVHTAPKRAAQNQTAPHLRRGSAAHGGGNEWKYT